MTELHQRALAVALREYQEEQRKKAQSEIDELSRQLAANHAKLSAGNERLLCAVLYEGKGEQN
jgi:hypothetical protein